MGVQNNAFFLALHNPKLQGVDPYDPHLSVEHMVMVGIECKVNPFYFFREVARAPAISGTVPGRIEFNRANTSMWWSFFNHVTYVLIQPRQTGKSFCVDLLMTQLFNFQCTNTQINLLTKDDKLRSENVKRLKNIYEELPAYLNLKTRDDVNNTEEITIKQLGNTYLTHVPQSSEKRAYNMGRGLTTAIVQIDEPPFQAHIRVAMEALLPAMGAAIDSAKRNGEPYGLLLTTTAGKKDDREGKFIYQYASDSARWSEKFYDAVSERDLEVMVRKNSRGVYRIYGSFSHRQLGKTDEWLRSQLERSGSSPENANRDYFNIWTSGTQHAPLPVATLEKLSACIEDELHQDISAIGGYITRWYIPQDKIEHFMGTRKTVLGVDTSDASGGDDISFVLTDVETGALVAIGTINETNLITFAQWLVAFIVKHENMTVIIERRSTGSTIIDYLLLFLPQKGVDPFKRLFNWVVNDPFEHKERYAEAKLQTNRRQDDIYVRSKKYFGFATSGTGETSRTELYSTTLQNAAKRCADKLKDRALTEQITGLVSRNGRVDHDVGGFDDLVIGWLLCHWFLTMAKNLQHYGIDARSVMVASKPMQAMTASQAYFHAQQMALRERIEAIFGILSAETDSFVCERLERELRFLDSQIVLEAGERFSVDAMLNQAKEERRLTQGGTPAYASDKTYYERLGYNTSSESGDYGLSSAPVRAR
jgi:hypothetical protein